MHESWSLTVSISGYIGEATSTFGKRVKKGSNKHVKLKTLTANMPTLAGRARPIEKLAEAVAKCGPEVGRVRIVVGAGS